VLLEQQQQAQHHCSTGQRRSDRLSRSESVRVGPSRSDRCSARSTRPSAADWAESVECSAQSSVDSENALAHKRIAGPGPEVDELPLRWWVGAWPGCLIASVLAGIGAQPSDCLG
jgi:hypothetical protein